MSAIESDEKLIIRVTDTGIGIEKAKFADIFDSFEQIEGDTKRTHSGTGLGLSVSQQLVELHGGELSVDSDLGIGSTFLLSLPMDKTGFAVDEVSTS